MAAKKEKIGGDVPVFDFSNASHRGWRRPFTLASIQLQRAAQRVDMISTPEHWEDNETYEQAILDYELATDDVERYIAQVLVSVPDDWKTANAPDDVDWSDPSSFAYLRANKMTALQEAATNAQREQAKN